MMRASGAGGFSLELFVASLVGISVGGMLGVPEGSLIVVEAVGNGVGKGVGESIGDKLGGPEGSLIVVEVVGNGVGEGVGDSIGDKLGGPVASLFEFVDEGNEVNDEVLGFSTGIKLGNKLDVGEVTGNKLCCKARFRDSLGGILGDEDSCSNEVPLTTTPARSPKY